MIKENKKNKIITFLCACLIVCASALGLVSAVGTTLASSPTQPTINSSYLNYYREDFNTLYDSFITGVATSSSNSVTFYITNIASMPVSSDLVATSYKVYSTYGTSFGQTINSSVSEVRYSAANLFGSLTTQLKLTFSNINAYLLSTNLVISFQYNSVYYVVGGYDIYKSYTAYERGLADADTTSAYNNGYNTGYNEGYEEGELEGYENGYQEGVDFGYTQGVNAVLNNPNNYGLYTQAQYNQNYTDGYNAGVTQGQNNVINNPNDFGLNTNQQLQDSYNQGFADGEQSSDAYQNGYDTGYIDGSNEVLNNPNNYNLYTQAQYEQNYTDGYTAGVLNSQYGILSNVDIDGIVNIGDLSGDDYIVEGVNNSDFDFNVGTITPNSGLLNLFNLIYGSSYDKPAMAQIRFTLSEQYIYSRDNVINFVNTSLLENSTSYLSITYETTSNTTVALMYSYNAISVDGVFAGYNIGVIGDDSSLLGNTIKSFVINYMFGGYSNGITLTRENLVKPQALSIFSTSVLFDNGYNLGYIDGTRSDVVNNAYDRGVVDGFNSGYSQGLANQNNATFASMISAVIDVPINAMRNLFNFELLGINLFGFFTALFTLLVVITIVRLILGGK